MVALFVFSLLYIAPGDPARSSPATRLAEDVERIRASLGLERPSWSASSSGSGTSCKAISALDLHQPAVSHMIAQRIEPTFSLMTLTLILSLSSPFRWA